jgi:hypothetical protein
MSKKSQEVLVVKSCRNEQKLSNYQKVVESSRNELEAAESSRNAPEVSGSIRK